MKRSLGTCYYPEHWSRDIWERDAQQMADLGLTWVRIGEFAWSRLEPVPGQFDFDWLDQAIDVLGRAGLQVVLGTPTATPPRWVVDKHPDMIAVDAHGHPRKFGSRRHYCFSHAGYRDETARIVTILAKRYGQNPYVAAWQTDNEYGCHDTILSYSDAARDAFRGWLRTRYSGAGNDGDIDALNAAWGNVFWSMEYNDFDQIDLPNLTVTEPNPAHVLDFRRFSSDQVVSYNRLQVDILRQYTDAPIAHNYMGRITDFDHYQVGNDLDIASWDSYPLGFLEDRVTATEDHRAMFYRQGDPDFQAFHHDLYRAVGRGRWWIMEQQPGPVNWAPYNPAPLPGMVRLWTWEAFAHGAEAVCYFRWRQAPMAQEQMHAGMLRPDSVPAAAYHEAAQVMSELADAPNVTCPKGDVALIFDYLSQWTWEIQPHCQGLSYFDIVFDVYRAMRSLGLSVDILSPDTDALDDYPVVFAPALMHIPPKLEQAIAATQTRLVHGPRSGARDASFNIPADLPPRIANLDATVSYVESLRPSVAIAIEGGGAIRSYREHIETRANVIWKTANGDAAMIEQGSVAYVCGVLDDAGWRRVVKDECDRAGIATMNLPTGLRTRVTEAERFWFNHLPHDITWNGFNLPAAGVIRQVKQ